MSRRKLDDLDLLVASMKESKRIKETFNEKIIQDLSKNYKSTCDKVRRNAAKIEKPRPKPVCFKTRAGAKHLESNQAEYTDSIWNTRGYDASQQRFDEDEIEFIKRRIKGLKEVRQLQYDDIKYLVIDVFLDELKQIKEGKFESKFHDRYHQSKGKVRSELITEIKTSLFTNEQRDYINGLLAGAFKLGDMDASGNIKHMEMNYVNVVMLAETTIRIVRFVHKFESNEEAYKFMVQKSRESLGADHS